MQNDVDLILIADVEIFTDAHVRDQLNAVVHMRSDTPENPYIHGTGMRIKRRPPCLANAAAWLEEFAAQTVVQNFVLRDSDARWNEAAIQRL
jgi:hypothetical protein